MSRIWNINETISDIQQDTHQKKEKSIFPTPTMFNLVYTLPEWLKAQNPAKAWTN